MPRPYNDVFSDFPEIPRSSRNHYLNTPPNTFRGCPMHLYAFFQKLFSLYSTAVLIIAYHNPKALKTFLQSMHNNAY